MHRINYALRSELATLAVLIAALAAQMPHAARLFASLAADDGSLHSWLYAIALETAVLVFVVRGRRNVSYMFAAVSVSVNLSYYAIAGVGLWQLTAFPAWLVSVSLPVAIMLYSHDMAAHADQPATTPQKATKPATVLDVPQAAKAQPAPSHTPTVATGELPELTPRQTAILAQIRAGVETRAAIAEVVGVHAATVGRDIKAMQEAGVYVNGMGGSR